MIMEEREREALKGRISGCNWSVLVAWPEGGKGGEVCMPFAGDDFELKDVYALLFCSLSLSLSLPFKSEFSSNSYVDATNFLNWPSVDPFETLETLQRLTFLLLQKSA